jgi:hypothetical protein
MAHSLAGMFNNTIVIFSCVFRSNSTSEGDDPADCIRNLETKLVPSVTFRHESLPTLRRSSANNVGPKKSDPGRKD